MNSGVVTGGWEYVIAAYAISALVYSIYAWRVMRDERRSRPEVR
jgi:nitrate/nitrite transporter NarK